MRLHGLPLAPLAIGAALATYVLAFRPRMNRWGATDDEVSRTLPGDTVEPGMSPLIAELTAGRRVSTRAITIDAPPDEVWPWLVQMGHGRAGFYSHDWVERLLGITYADGHSATRIHPELQDLHVGDSVPYHPFANMPVLALDRPHVFQAGERLILEPLDGGRRTRVIARTTAGWLEPLAGHVPVFAPVLRPIAAVIDRGPGELLHHYMETGMLKGLKARVEATHRSPDAGTGTMAKLPKGTPAVAWEIAPDVYCLGPKGRTQTDVYFVRSGSSWALIDAGWASDGPAIRQAAEAVFGADTRPTAILLTHDHPDHAGAALWLARTWDRPVYVHPDELAQAIGDFAAMTAAAGPLDTWVILPLMRAMGRRRREAMLAGSSLKGVVRSYDPAAGVPGLPGWDCIHTPGHTPGHVSFFRPADRVLITGDSIVTLQVNSLSGIVLGRAGLSGPPWYTTCSPDAARQSVALLARLEPQVLAGGHGVPMIGPDTPDRLRAFAAGFSDHADQVRAVAPAG